MDVNVIRQNYIVFGISVGEVND